MLHLTNVDLFDSNYFWEISADTYMELKSGVTPLTSKPSAKCSTAQFVVPWNDQFSIKVHFICHVSPSSIPYIILEITSSLCDLAFSKDERMYLNWNKNSSESK